MFETLDQEIERTEDASEKKGKLITYIGGAVVTLVIFLILVWSMSAYKG